MTNEIGANSNFATYQSPYPRRVQAPSVQPRNYGQNIIPRDGLPVREDNIARPAMKPDKTDYPRVFERGELGTTPSSPNSGPLYVPQRPAANPVRQRRSRPETRLNSSPHTRAPLSPPRAAVEYPGFSIQSYHKNGETSYSLYGGEKPIFVNGSQFGTNLVRPIDTKTKIKSEGKTYTFSKKQQQWRPKTTSKLTSIFQSLANIKLR